MTTSDTLLAKKSLPMPPVIKPLISNVTPKPQNIQKPFLPPPPLPPKLLLEQLSMKIIPQLPLKKPPLRTTPSSPPPTQPPPPLPTLPSNQPFSPAPNQMLMQQDVSTQLLLPNMQPQPPLSPYHFLPMNSYLSLQNTAKSYANSKFSLSQNMISSVPEQYPPHETMGSIQFIGESVSQRQLYGENYNQSINMTQKQQQLLSEFHRQENGQKYNDNRAFNRDGVFVGGNYGNGSQYFVDDGPHDSNKSGPHHVDNSSQLYSQSRHKNRQVRHHPYQRR